jgi:hypothetical protein
VNARLKRALAAIIIGPGFGTRSWSFGPLTPALSPRRLKPRSLAIATGLILAGSLFVSLEASSAQGAFRAGDGQIVFTNAPYGYTKIVVMNPDGTDYRILTEGAGSDSGPAWSPDGMRIAFTRASPQCCEIFVMNSDGSDQTNITNNALVEVAPSWSPDGTKIAFTVLPNGYNDGEIFVMNADGSDRINLTNNAANDILPAWSPDGRKIAFTSDRDGPPGPTGDDIYVMNVDGSDQHRLAEGRLRPAWSPDSTKIAFVKETSSDIFVMNADGTGETKLTNNPESESNPDWSPDGTRIVFERNNFGNHELIVMHSDGSGQTNTHIFGYQPNWSAPWTRSPPPPPGPPPPPPPPPPRPCTVPRVVGLTLGQARTRIRARHCSVGRIRRAYSRRPGRIIGQSPQPGTVRRRAFPVRLAVGRR